jgi:hypothetical protein
MRSLPGRNPRRRGSGFFNLARSLGVFQAHMKLAQRVFISANSSVYWLTGRAQRRLDQK